MHIRFITLLTLLLSTQSVLLYSQSSAGTSDTKQAIDDVERIIQESEKEEDDDYVNDLVGITVKDTLHAATMDGLIWGSITYLYRASNGTSPKLNRINKDLTWCTNCALLRPLRDFEKERINGLYDERDIERGNILLQAFEPTDFNAQLAGTMFAQFAGATLAYGGLRAATKEFTGYDAAPLVQDSTQVIAAQTIGHYMAPAPCNIKLFTKNQVASYVATDLTVAAGMYVYKETTGKKLKFPKIPDAIRGKYINEKNLGTAVYMGIKYAMRTYVMNKLCGVPAAA